jgi:hypothetical protein
MNSKVVCCLTLAALVAVPSGAFARSHKNAQVTPEVPAITLPELDMTAPALSLPTPPLAEVQLTGSAPSPAAGPRPSVLEPLRRLSCVPYARLRSGLQIFGDAKTWWRNATSLYAKITAPVEEAVMVFAGSGRLSRGHVAVVSQVVNAREIRVDHANWQNHGEIDLNMPVEDVSKDNDWSQVKVWNVATKSFGTHIYRISGFIAHGRR